jgi:hypothetical protein
MFFDHLNTPHIKMNISLTCQRDTHLAAVYYNDGTPNTEAERRGGWGGPRPPPKKGKLLIYPRSFYKIINICSQIKKIA